MEGNFVLCVPAILGEAAVVVVVVISSCSPSPLPASRALPSAQGEFPHSPCTPWLSNTLFVIVFKELWYVSIVVCVCVFVCLKASTLSLNSYFICVCQCDKHSLNCYFISGIIISW